MVRAVPRIDLKGVSLGYDGRPVLAGVSGSFAPGSLTAIIGPNGSGKSTLAKALAGVLTPLAGSIGIAGAPRSGAIGYLPQQAELRRDFPITVYDVVALGLWRQVGAFGRVGRDQRAAIARALEEVRLADLGDRQIGALSGGQFQRVLFARLIVQDAPVILLDEPFTAVDQQTIADLLEIIGRWHAEGRTVIAVLHNVELVEALFPDVVILHRGLAGWGPTVTVLAGYDHVRLGHGVDELTRRRFARQLEGRAA